MDRAEIKNKYTCVHPWGKGYRTMLTVGCQSFFVCDERTKKDANWYADMLSIAIENILKEIENGKD